MSNHSGQKAINLHHTQVMGGKSRKAERQARRVQGYSVKSKELRQENNIVLAFGFLCFAYIMLIPAVYLGRIL